jgi:hypothetical protein
MKKRFVLAVAVALALSVTAQGQLSVSIGSGDGSLAFTKIYPAGHVDGDDATYDPPGAVAATTLWNLGFLFHDGTTAVWADKDFTAHTAQAAVGTNTPASSSFSSTNITFPGIANLTGSLNFTLTQPVAGDVVRGDWAWTFNNAAASPKNLRILYFVDVDSYLGSNLYDDDRAALASSVAGYTFGNSRGGIAVGENSSGAVNLDQGVLLDVNKAPNGFYGIDDLPTGSYGSSYYWSSQFNYASGGSACPGPEVGGFEIPALYKYKVQNDAGNDYVSDAGGDCGGVIQVDLVIPASGSDSVTFSATWGLNATVGPNNYVPPAETADWALYN